MASHPLKWCIALIPLLAAAVAAADVPAGERAVRLPHRLMMGTEIVREIFLQTGTRYAYPSGALLRQIDATPLDGRNVLELASKLAPAVGFTNDVLVLEQELVGGRLATLTKDLHDADHADVRRVAAYELGCSKSARAIAPLLAAMGDADESVRHHVLRSLDRLERDFRTYSPAGRVSIFELAGRDANAPVVRALQAAADETTNQWIWSAELLGRFAETAAVDELSKGVQNGYARTAEVARWAVRRMQVSKRTPEVPLADRRDAASLAGLMKDLAEGDTETKAFALRTLARRVDADARALREALADLKDAELRAEMLLALGRHGGAAVWDLLLEEVRSQDPMIRRAAIRALARCPEDRAVEPLFKWLAGPDIDSDDRNVAAMSLGMIGSKAVVRRLSEYVDSVRTPISVTPMALGWTYDLDAVPALIKCLNTDSDPAKSFAFVALEKLDSVKGYEAIAATYGQDENIARYMGTAAIRRSGHNQAVVDHVVGVLKAGRGRIAPHALEEAEDPRAVDALIDQLPTSKGTRLMWAIQALGRIGDPKGAAALIAELDDPSEGMQYQALRALRWRWYAHRADVLAALAKHPIFKAFSADPPAPADQPPNTWVLRSWPIDYDDTRVCNTTYEAGLVYCDDAAKVLKWGAHGQRCDTPQLGETWLYDVAANTWKYSGSPIEPFGMCGTWGLAYDRANRRVVSVQAEGANHGWQWVWGRATRVSVPWLYEPAADRWIPARCPVNPGQRGFQRLVYDDAHQVVMLFGGQGGDKRTAGSVWLYDGYANTWDAIAPPRPAPGSRTNYGMVYLPARQRVLLTGGVYGGADNRTWLYNVAANAWTDAKAAGDPPTFTHEVRYDPPTGSVLAFRTHENHAPVLWQYDVAGNLWTKLPAPEGPSPHHDSADVAYDPVHDVYVLDGGHTGWETDHIGVREVWTYKPSERPEAAKSELLPAPAGVTVDTRGENTTVTWQPVAGAAGYHVYRGSGQRPWQASFAKATDPMLRETRFVDTLKLQPGFIMHYYVTAVDADGREGAASGKVRAQPAFPLDVTASPTADRTVELAWSASPSRDVVGYHVYAAHLKAGDEIHPSAVQRFDEFVRLTEKPVTELHFTDARPLGPAEGIFGHEVRGYQVRAVNVRGAESGPSPTALSLTGSVPHVTAAEQADGSTLVRWEPVAEQNVRGYAVFRMDDFRRTLAVRLNEVPLEGDRYADFCEAPRAERRRYYVVAIDALGQMGLPSTGAWAFGRP